MGAADEIQLRVVKLHEMERGPGLPARRRVVERLSGREVRSRRLAPYHQWPIETWAGLHDAASAVFTLHDGAPWFGLSSWEVQREAIADQLIGVARLEPPVELVRLFPLIGVHQQAQ